MHNCCIGAVKTKHADLAHSSAEVQAKHFLKKNKKTTVVVKLFIWIFQ